MIRSEDHCWAVALAGGGGRRLAFMTTDASGVVVPKQYCAFVGGRSLLGDTLDRDQVTVHVRAGDHFDADGVYHPAGS